MCATCGSVAIDFHTTERGKSMFLFSCERKRLVEGLTGVGLRKTSEVIASRHFAGIFRTDQHGGELRDEWTGVVLVLIWESESIEQACETLLKIASDEIASCLAYEVLLYLRRECPGLLERHIEQIGPIVARGTTCIHDS